MSFWDGLVIKWRWSHDEVVVEYTMVFFTYIWKFVPPVINIGIQNVWDGLDQHQGYESLIIFATQLLAYGSSG